jgi:hypothetical protein
MRGRTLQRDDHRQTALLRRLQAQITSSSRTVPKANGRQRILLPLPRARIRNSGSKTSSQFKVMTSLEPCNSIRPTTAKSREARKPDQNRVTSSTDKGITMRLGSFTPRSTTSGEDGYKPAATPSIRNDETLARKGPEGG